MTPEQEKAAFKRCSSPSYESPASNGSQKPKVQANEK